MRELTFAGFIKNYVRSLSLSGTNSLYRLAEEAVDINPRLREPLLLYAVFTDKTDILLRALKADAIKSEYQKLVSTYDKTGFEAALQETMSPLPEGYKKVWKSYLNKKHQLQNDNHTKELMLNKVIKLQREKGVSNYRIYSDLALNPGNLNAWLKHGIHNKVSLETARRTVKYLEDSPQTR